MGSVRRKTVTKKLPANAEVVVENSVRVARWVDGRGRRKTAKIIVGRNGSDRIIVQSKTYTAKYRDADGITQEVATGCRNAQAARAVLRDLEARVEKVKAGIVSSAEDRIAKHQRTPIGNHIDAYLTKLEADDTSADHRDNVAAFLESHIQVLRLLHACGL